MSIFKYILIFVIFHPQKWMDGQTAVTWTKLDTKHWNMKAIYCIQQDWWINEIHLKAMKQWTNQNVTYKTRNQ